jgi:hypothetical protein
MQDKQNLMLKRLRFFDAKIGRFQCKIMAYDFDEAKSKLRDALNCALAISTAPYLLNGSVTDENGETFRLNFSDLTN